MFDQDGGDVTPAKPQIDIIHISKQSTTSEALVIPKDLITGINGISNKSGRRNANNIGLEAAVNQFKFSGNKPAEVLALKNVSVDANIKLTVSFSSALKSCISRIAKLSLKLPSYMSFTATTTSGELTVQGNEITLANISTASSIPPAMPITRHLYSFKNCLNSSIVCSSVFRGIRLQPSSRAQLRQEC